MSSDITGFRVEISDADIADLRERLARTRWPEKETVDDWSQGIPLAYVQELCDYWREEYDVQRVADRLNAYGQFRTQIDGVDIHFLHVSSPHADATPMIMTHGWPGSVLEFMDVIAPLVDPTAHGGDAADALHLVMPSLPGYGFSGKPAETGWDIHRIARAWDELMGRLGYERYIAQGGDWGGIITTSMGHQGSERLAGIHLNIAIASPEALMALGELTEEEQGQLGGLVNYQEHESGYAHQQGTRPQTLGYGLTDSPAGQCAWIVEKFRAWSDCGDHPENSFSRDALLDNVMVYWLTGTAASSARLYWHSIKPVFTDFPEVPVPTAYSVFPKEILRQSERWVRTRYTDLRHYGVQSRGGHFAALEVPDLFVDEVRAGVRALDVRASAMA